MYLTSFLVGMNPASHKLSNVESKKNDEILGLKPIEIILGVIIGLSFQSASEVFYSNRKLIRL